GLRDVRGGQSFTSADGEAAKSEEYLIGVSPVKTTSYGTVRRDIFLTMLLTRVVFIVLLAIWFVLTVFLGKGGFVHLLLLNALGVGFTELLINYRTRMAA